MTAIANGWRAAVPTHTPVFQGGAPSELDALQGKVQEFIDSFDALGEGMLECRFSHHPDAFVHIRISSAERSPPKRGRMGFHREQRGIKRDRMGERIGEPREACEWQEMKKMRRIFMLCLRELPKESVASGSSPTCFESINPWRDGKRFVSSVIQVPGGYLSREMLSFMEAVSRFEELRNRKERGLV